jgi:hypothetical protein
MALRQSLALAVLLTLATAAPAWASGPERCLRHENEWAGGETEICLLNPANPAEPWAANQAIQMRAPAEVDQLRVTWRNSDEPEYNAANLDVQPAGPGPGGTTIWQGAISPWLGTPETASIPRDGSLVLSVQYWSNGTLQGTVTFTDLPVLGFVNEITESLRRRGKRFVGTYSANTRAPAAAEEVLYIWATTMDGNYRTSGKRVIRSASTSGGVLRVVAKLPRRYVRRQCQRFRHCSVIAEGSLQMEGLILGSNIPFIRRLKVK